MNISYDFNDFLIKPEIKRINIVYSITDKVKLLVQESNSSFSIDSCFKFD